MDVLAIQDPEPKAALEAARRYDDSDYVYEQDFDNPLDTNLIIENNVTSK